MRLFLPAPERKGRKSACVDPHIRYGKPLVGGVETRAPARCVDAGEELAELAEDYGLQPEAVMDALIFEGSLA